MAYEKVSRHLAVFVCDCCGNETIEITEDLDNYKECWGHARTEGWRLRDGEHHCPDCAGLKS